MTADQVRELARACGFELAGVARAMPAPDFSHLTNRELIELLTEMAKRFPPKGDHRAALNEAAKRLKAIADLGLDSNG